MTKEINLRKFCKEYKGGLEAVMPIAGFRILLKSLREGKITDYQGKEILKEWFTLIDHVGIKDGKPYAAFNERGCELLRKAQNKS